MGATFCWVSLVYLLLKTTWSFERLDLLFPRVIINRSSMLHPKVVAKAQRHSRALAVTGDYPLNAVELNVETGDREDPFRLRVY